MDIFIWLIGKWWFWVIIIVGIGSYYGERDIKRKDMETAIRNSKKS